MLVLSCHRAVACVALDRTSAVETLWYDVVYSWSVVARSRCLLPDRLLGVALTLGVVQNPIFDLESDQA